MTIASETSRSDYIGAGTTDTYDYTFRILSEEDLRVTTRDTAGSETTLALNTDYTVTGVGGALGGTIVLTAGVLATDYALAIVRDRAFLQETDIRNQGDFFPESIEDALDSIVMQVQTLSVSVDGAVRLPDTAASVSSLLPIPSADTFLAWNSDGDSLVNADLATIDSIATFSGGLEKTGVDVHITDLGVTSDKLAADAVTSDKLDTNIEVDGTITAGTDVVLDGAGTITTLKGNATSARTVNFPDVSGYPLLLAAGEVSTLTGPGKSGTVAISEDSGTVIQRARVEYNTTTAVNIYPGAYILRGATTRRVSVDSLIAFTAGSGGSNAGSTNLGASEWHYLYIDDTAATAETLTAAMFLNSTTAPVGSNTKRGYYNGDDLCIYAFRTTSGSDIEIYWLNNELTVYDARKEDASAITPSSTFTDVTLTIPAFSRMALVTFEGIYQNATARYSYRTNGSAGTGHYAGRVIVSVAEQFYNTIPVITDDDGIIEVKWESATTNTSNIYTEGWYLPEGM
jgi:hypothetical protein